MEISALQQFLVLAETLNFTQAAEKCFVTQPTLSRKIAVLENETAGRVMEVYTDLPGVQFYAGNGLHQQGKSAFYGQRAGFCLETQAIPNNVNVPEYAEKGSSILDAGAEYSFHATYKFE